MDYFVDWSFRLTSGESFPNEAIRAMEHLNKHFGISRFAVMPEFDARLCSVPMFLLQADRCTDLLREALPSHLKIKLLPRVYLSRGLALTEWLNRLSFGRNRYLALQLPWGEYGDWMDDELHQLLYDRRYRLLLTSCELYSSFYSSETVERLFRIPQAVYQFNYRALSDEGMCQHISKMIGQDQTVLLGTGLTTLGKTWQYGLSHYQKAATKNLSVADYQRLLHQNRVFWDLPQR